MKNQQKLTKSLWLILLCFLTTIVSAQEIEVSGKVVGQADGIPLPGVTITIQGTTNGATTDFDGNYSITVPGPESKLVYSYIGFAEQTITVGNQTIINVSLKASTTDLDEVVVVGYGSVRRRDLTGAVASVKGSTVEKGNPLSVQNALAGRVAGVQVSQTDNAPGAGMRILIRGGSTLTGGNQPLFVIDNFPILPNDDDPTQNPLADLNPNDIESIQVLKDASATAVFGAEGANGVVIITTKLGKAGKPRIDVNYRSSLSTMVNTPDILSPDEYLDWQIEKRPIDQFYDPTIGAGTWEAIRASGQPGNVWIDRITRPAQTQQVDLSFSGGADGMKYRLSGGYLGQEGVIKNSEFNRSNLSANLEQRISEKIKIGSTLTYASKEAKGMVNSWDEGAIIKTALQVNPFMPEDFEINDEDLDDPTYVWNSENVLTFMDEVDISNKTERFIGNLFLQYQLAKGVNFYTSYGINSFSDNYQEFYPSTVRRGFNPGGIARFRDRKITNTAYQARLNFNKTIKKHRFNATTVFEAKTSETILKTFGAEGFEDESRGLYDLSSVSTAYFPSNVVSEFSSLSYLGRFNYNYDGKYLLTASFRADGSSKFGKNNKWGYFPSLALSWVASKENFIKNLNTFDNLKLRLSYGKTGNNQIPTYQSLASLSTVRYIFDDNLFVGLVPGGVANPDLKWETTSQYNIGLDMAFLNNRISISADAYYKETNDLLLDVQLPQTSGFDRAIQNVGSISNQGLEIAINTTNIQNDNFTWTSAFTYSTNRNKVLDLGEQNELFFSRQFHFRLRDEVLIREGESIGSFYGFIEDEILNSDTEIANSPEHLILENVVGGVKIKDVNGDGIVNNDDKVIIGNTQPEFIGGLNNEFTYKNFDLSFFMRWSYGNDVINGNVVFLDRVGVGNWNTLQSYVDNAFSPLNPSGTVHGQVPDTYGNLMRSSYVEDGSFLKCDYITLGYTLPEDVVNKSGIKRMRIYARVDNPFMITRYSWYDPEVSTGFGTVARVAPGVDLGTYPRATTFTLGASIGL